MRTPTGSHKSTFVRADLLLLVRSKKEIMCSSKTGLYPRDEIPFEEMPSGVVDNKQTKVFKSIDRLNVDKETLTKIQNKKNVEKQIETKEKAMEKGILIF